MAKKLNQISGMPRVEVAFSGWQSALSFVKISEVNDRGEITTTENIITFQGSVQPLSPEQVELKPEGQRSFEWLQIHAFNDVDLQINDRIIYDGQRFKVMNKLDYRLNGYREYHIYEDYES